ncbi:MAG: CotH kinase family protein [Bacteroidales bacterium]
MLSFWLVPLAGYGQIVINEICPRNASVISDDDKEPSDWIELYNASDESVNLVNYYLSDNLSNPEKWKFPEVILPPDSFLLIFASGNDRKIVIDHWETIVKAENSWRYWIPDADPDSQWHSVGYVDTLWAEGAGGFGRGNGDDNTILPDSVATVYIRKVFNIPDTAVLAHAFLHVDYDDAFVAYLNGIEIARANIGWPGKYQHWNDISYGIHYAQMYQDLPPDEYFLNKELVRSIIKEGTNVLAIQGLNAWNNHGNSSLIPFLSVAVSDTANFFQPVPEWFGSKPVYLHTNFKLSGEGETVVLSDDEGNIIDYIEYSGVSADHSTGRIEDGYEPKGLFVSPSPGSSNNGSAFFEGYTKTPLVNIHAGFYTNPLSIEILNINIGDTLRYSLDGSIVTDSSLLYTGPIAIDSTTVLKTRFFKTGLIPGKTTTNTYIVNYTSTFPVISISMDPYDLWDWEEGIYVKGPNAQPGFPYWGANFWQDWEKPLYLEYFDTLQNLAFALDADVVIHGGQSRAYDQKSLRILTNGKYEISEINYKIFGKKDIDVFRKLVLRNSGQDFNHAHFRDAFMQSLVEKNTNIDVQAYEPSVVFLNGEYWGIYNIREKIYRYYVQSNFGVHPDSVELLRDNRMVVEGNYYHYQPMIEYIKSVPVVDSLVYDSILKLVDIDNYTDYFIAEMFFVNHDWPLHNTKYWRKSDDTGIWRYILTDTDFGFGLISNVTDNELYRVLHNNIQWSDNHWILRRLLENQNYREYFINRSADLFNSCLHPGFITDRIMAFKNRLAPEITYHKQRWGGTLEAWESEVDEMISFGENRGGFVKQHYINEFDLEKTINVLLNIDSIHHGKVKINTLIPDTLPWQGEYFDGNPVTISAIPDSGFLFSHWVSSMILQELDSVSSVLHINVDTNTMFIAYFYPDTTIILADTPFVVINEINYNPNDTLDSGDWIELYNPDTISYNISKWVFKDGNDDHEFVFPDSLQLDTNGYLVLYRDAIKFNDIFPGFENAIGPFDFGLSADGEELRLFDSTGMMVYSVLYSAVSPWPEDANGNGKTINIKDPYLNPNIGSNWISGCVGGSPGGPAIECDTVGIINFKTGNFKLEIFPNPVSDILNLKFNIESQQNIQFDIFNFTGTKTASMSFELNPGQSNHFQVNLKNLPDGVYIIHLYTVESYYIQKFVVKK